MIALHVTMGHTEVDKFTDIVNGEMVALWGTKPAPDMPHADMQRLEAAAIRGADIVVIYPHRT